MNHRKTLQEVTGHTRRIGLHVVRSLLLAAACVACLPLLTMAAPLEPDGYVAFYGEEFVSMMEGRVGFQRETGGIGTFNDFREELGLPKENQTLRLEMLVRPLEHHVLRVYGTLPESYSGDRILERELIFRNQTLPAGTRVESTMRIGQFGLGYDLDFIMGRHIQAGANADMRFLDYLIRLKGGDSGLENTLTLDEVVPCVGGHTQALIKPTLIPWPPGLSVGGFARLTYGINPNYLNLYDIKFGVTGAAIMPFGTVVTLKAGYQIEGWSQINVAGRDLEFRRDGVFVGVASSF